MNKICNSCGNIIPEGMTACPNCASGAGEDLLKNALNMDIPEIEIPVIQEDDNKTVEEKSAKPGPQQAKRPANGQKRPQNGQSNGQRKPANGQNPQRKRPQQPVEEKKSGRSAVIGITIGLVAALLLVLGGAVLMLYKLGFFVRMTDEQLLATNRPETPVESVVDVPVTQIPEELEPEPAPPVVEDSSMEVESVFEEVLPEEVVEEEVAVEEYIPEVTKFRITGAETIYLNSRGQTVEPVYIIEPASASKYIEWTSSDTSIATVNELGVIAARRGGSATITGTCGGMSIVVYIQCNFTVPETVLDMNYEDITMNYEGQLLELAVDYELTEEQIASTVWESSDPSVATVDETGLVTAISSGTSVVTATIGEYTASCIVRCVNVTGNKGVNNDSSEFVINWEDVTLTRKGEYFQLTLKSVIGNEPPEFKWYTSNKDVATVDPDGTVTAISNGVAYITTTCGGDDFRCTVRVNIDE